ncbi:hypothetical protein [Chryseobacterium carnipullorum]|uniref:Uncharacterized protein n=1 Tax=Chryseobacterium carnipullorum TaxID=1124835 RepID=A0A376DUE5_CHRCU|nr:hypothetical protein [Chryseobacterium carnipullorum]STC95366.1 Uncharacterised protein [Chryseobacterium carnipullorum]
MAGNKFIAYEFYSSAKMMEAKEQLNFQDALQKAFNKKYGNLPDQLIPKVGIGVDGDVNASRKLLKETLAKQRDKDSIDYGSALALCKSYLNYKTFSQLKPHIVQWVELKDKEKFITDTKDLKTKNGNTLTITIVRKKENTAPLPSSLPIISTQDLLMLFLAKEQRSIIM